MAVANLITLDLSLYREVFVDSVDKLIDDDPVI